MTIILSALMQGTPGTSSGAVPLAVSIAAGTTGQIPYQTAASTTSFFGPGTAGTVLVSNGTAAPSYANTVALTGAISASNLSGTNTGDQTNISGNAATATSASGLVNFTAATSTNPSNVDSPTTLDVVGYCTQAGLPFSQGDGGLYTAGYSTAWYHQIYGDFRTGQIAVRAKNSGTWQGWRTVLDSSNYNSYSPTLTGGNASGTWSISITGGTVSATTGYFTTGVSIAGNGTGHDPYGTMAVTEPANAINYSYYGLTRSGNLGAGFGLSGTNGAGGLGANAFWFGPTSSTSAGAMTASWLAFNASSLVVPGTLSGTATSARYADLAENYAGDATYLPGTIVMFGGPEEVTLCNTDMCRRIAGIVSTNPAHLMNADLDSEFVVPVALQGRVDTFVQGTVRKGDMMVSAGNGRARAEACPCMGSVIGKALADFDGELGVIEIVVGRL